MQIILSSCKKFRAVQQDGQSLFKVYNRTTEEEIGIIRKKEERSHWVFIGVFSEFNSTELMDLSCLVSTCRLSVEPWLDPFQEPE